MSYCEKCGVELDMRMNICPLCGTEAQVQRDLFSLANAPIPKIETKKETVAPTPKKVKPIRRIFWEFGSILFLIAIIISIAYNFMTFGTITWGMQVSAMLFCGWGILSSFTFALKRVGLLIVLTYIFATVVLILLQTLTMATPWFSNIAMPLNSGVFAIVLLFAWIIQRFRIQDYNLAATITMAIAGCTLIIDGILGSSAFAANLDWSLVALFTGLVFSAILSVMGYRNSHE